MIALVFITILYFVNTAFIEPVYPVWAHKHWIWFNGKGQNQFNLLDMVATYQSYNITVGALNIDSAWSSQFNNFKWNRTKFPDPEGMINYLHSEGIKVTAWATSIINNDSSNYQYAKDKGYLLNKGQTIKWWHGTGSFIDYRNQQAVNWWHQQMNLVLDIGLDGWKTDDSDAYLHRLKPWPYSQKITNLVTYRQYANSYYRDFFHHTRTKNANSLIMSRPIDSENDQKTYHQFSPIDVVFSGWVGDQDSSYDGFKFALKNVFHSAWKGYLNFGFDIGGYRGQNISKNGFIRYAQTGSMLPLMQNGGGGRHCPWLFDFQTVQIYRKFVQLHLNLIPYFLTAGTQALIKKISVIQPLAQKQGAIAPFHPSSFGYLLWKDILVHSIFNDEGTTTIDFPKDSNWIYYFNHEKVFRDKTTVRVKLDLDQSPIFLRMGSTIPFANKYILVYPSSSNYSRTIYSQNYTDYISYFKSNISFDIKIQRFYKDSFLQIDSYTSIEIIGAIKYNIDSKYSPRFKDNTLIFNLPLNTTVSITDFIIDSMNESKNTFIQQQ